MNCILPRYLSSTIDQKTKCIQFPLMQYYLFHLLFICWHSQVARHNKISAITYLQKSSFLCIQSLHFLPVVLIYEQRMKLNKCDNRFTKMFYFNIFKNIAIHQRNILNSYGISFYKDNKVICICISEVTKTYIRYKQAKEIYKYTYC